MRKFIRRFLLTVAAIVLILIGAVILDFGFFRGRTPRITGSPASVASLESINLGGVKQWILVRGWNVSNPVVLFLHGGPGMPAMFLAHDFQRQLERDFVMVQWDRRGAGKSYRSGIDGDLTVRQTLDDIYELTRLLQARFGRKRIYLIGHSWGSYFGMLASWEHPELFAAYIGVGQVAADPQREFEARKAFLLRRARAAGDSHLLKELESPTAKITEDDIFRYGGELFKSKSFWPILFSGLRAPEYTFRDALNVKKGADLVLRKMQLDVISGSLMDNVKSVRIPVFFFLGRHDYNTPSSLAEEYLKSLDAPLKEVVWFENSAHFAFYEEPKLFHKQMVRIDGVTRSYWAGSEVGSAPSSKTR